MKPEIIMDEVTVPDSRVSLKAVISVMLIRKHANGSNVLNPITVGLEVSWFTYSHVSYPHISSAG